MYYFLCLVSSNGTQVFRNAFLHGKLFNTYLFTIKCLNCIKGILVNECLVVDELAGLIMQIP